MRNDLMGLLLSYTHNYNVKHTQQYNYKYNQHYTFYYRTIFVTLAETSGSFLASLMLLKYQ